MNEFNWFGIGFGCGMVFSGLYMSEVSLVMVGAVIIILGFGILLIKVGDVELKKKKEKLDG